MVCNILSKKRTMLVTYLFIASLGVRYGDICHHILYLIESGGISVS